jgi:hypothetical protein
MTATLDARTPPDADERREKVAARLLASSARHFYDPNVDIDWAADEVPGMPHMPLHRTSLYGTELWDRMTPEQRIELSKHEAISVARVGLWFEVLLMGMLAAHIYNCDPATNHAQYGLTEIGDETRHSIMFARWAARYGGASYGPPKRVHRLGKLFRLIAPGTPSMWAATLVAEELLDRVQRETMTDESIQPLTRMISRIHVTEEARHVSYARDELPRAVASCGPVALRFQRLLTAVTAYAIADVLISPRVYSAVGLDPAEGRAAARSNPHFHESLRWMGEKVMAFLADNGMVDGGVTRRVYRAAHLI